MLKREVLVTKKEHFMNNLLQHCLLFLTVSAHHCSYYNSTFSWTSWQEPLSQASIDFRTHKKLLDSYKCQK